MLLILAGLGLSQLGFWQIERTSWAWRALGIGLILLVTALALMWRTRAARLTASLAEHTSELSSVSQALHQTERNLATTLKSVGDAVLATDVQRRITWMNPVAEKLTGWPQADAIGRPVEEVFRIVNEESRESAVVPVDAVLTSGEIRGLANHTALIARHGAEIAIADSAAPIRDQTGAIVGVVLVFRDVTAERRAQAELDRFFTLSIDMLCIAGTDGRFKRINPAFSEILGFTSEELLARPFLDFVHPDDRTATLAELEKLAQGVRTLQFENRYRCKDDSWRWLSWRAQPFPAENAIYAAARDISERKQAEEQLERLVEERTAEVVSRERQLRAFIANVPGVVYVSELEAPWRMSMISDAVHDLTGWEARDFLQSQIDWAALVLPEDLPQVEQAVRRAIATREPFRIEYRIRHKDGSVRWVFELGRVRFTGEGVPEVLEGNIFDSTERVEAEKDMRQARAILDAMADAAFVFDPGTLRFQYVNEGAIRLLGYTLDEFLEMTPLDIDPDYSEEQFREMIAPILQSGRRQHQIATRARHKNGRDIPVEINLQYSVEAHERPCFIAVVRDITERRNIEQQAARSQRLEAIGTLAGGVAHDLNNALSPILMGGELLRANHPNPDKIIDLIKTSATHAANMVKQLLTFAKGVEGERVLLKTRHLFKEMQKIVSGTFPKNIELRVRCDKELWDILGDATQLHQVLLNLCVNARDAMPNGGTLTLEAENIHVDAAYASAVMEATPGRHVVWHVKDTGIGIAPDVLDRIFEPFFTTKGPERGTGLGLSTVIGIVKSHRGFTKVYSAPGQGSTFTVAFPAADTASGDTELLTRVETAFRGNGETILVVDDTPAVREIITAVLEDLNFRVISAGDGTDGLIQVAEHRVELHAVITDLRMPHMDGLHFARALKRMLPQVPIIVVSGRLEELDESELRDLGVNAFLDKPFTQEKLVQALRSAVDASNSAEG